MTPPVLLIAEREFRAYVVTASFWAALVAGPAVIGLALGVAALSIHSPAPVSVALVAPDAAAERAAMGALATAARIEGRAISVRPSAAGPAAASVVVSQGPDGQGAVRFEGAVPLSAAGRALAATMIERDALAARLGAPTAPGWRIEGLAAPAPALEAGRTARFALVMMLWLTLTGSLGMLLSAVVRERSSRALETLLGAARPSDIVFGKLVGVGAVSLLVLAVWLGAAALAPLATGGSGPTGAVLAALGDPATLARAVVIYVAGYLFYGLLTIALGAAARDVAHAQNLSRPMFAVLLAAFFAALASVAGAATQLGWLVWAPPFTPFLLLLLSPQALSPALQALALGVTLAAAALCGLAAMRQLRMGRSQPA